MDGLLTMQRHRYLPGCYWRQIVHCYPRTCHIAGDQQRNEDHGRTKAGTDQAEENKAGTVVRHLKLLPNQLRARAKVACPAAAGLSTPAIGGGRNCSKSNL